MKKMEKKKVGEGWGIDVNKQLKGSYCKNAIKKVGGGPGPNGGSGWM